MSLTPTQAPSTQAPLDLKPKWLNLARRLQAEASKNQGSALMRITLLLDETNTPVAWGPPELKKIEPRESAGQMLMDIAKSLCQVD